MRFGVLSLEAVTLARLGRFLRRPRARPLTAPPGSRLQGGTRLWSRAAAQPATLLQGPPVCTSGGSVSDPTQTTRGQPGPLDAGTFTVVDEINLEGEMGSKHKWCAPVCVCVCVCVCLCVCVSRKESVCEKTEAAERMAELV